MSARTPGIHPAETLEQDVDELFSLLWETLAGLKRASPPPEELREVGRRASLTARHMPAVLAVAAGGPLSVSELARRLEVQMRPHDFVARLGGDEFGIILTDIADPEATLWRLRAIIDQEIDIGGLSLSVDASIGFALALM